MVLEAARRRGQAADHLLFAGPPGVGKTSLSGIVAVEMGVQLHLTSGPALERAGDLAAILTKLDDGDVLFIDEIHRLSRAVEEILYPAMEDFQLDIVVGKGPAASSIRLSLPRFTLVGATTRTGLLTGPLRDRFGLVARLDYYAPEELEAIVDAGRPHPGRDDRQRGGVGDRPPQPGDAPHRQPPAAPGAGLRRGAGGGLHRPEHRPRRAGAVRRGRARARQGRPGHPRRPVPAVRRRSRRPLDPRHQRERADRDGGGRVRALPHPAGTAGAHTTRAASRYLRRGSTSASTCPRRSAPLVCSRSSSPSFAALRLAPTRFARQCVGRRCDAPGKPDAPGSAISPPGGGGRGRRWSPARRKRRRTRSRTWPPHGCRRRGRPARC